MIRCGSMAALTACSDAPDTEQKQAHSAYDTDQATAVVSHYADLAEAEDDGDLAAEHLAAAHLDRADLGDARVDGLAAGGLEVDHHEGDVTQGRAEVIEGELLLHDEAWHAPDARREVRHRRARHPGPTPRARRLPEGFAS